MHATKIIEETKFQLASIPCIYIRPADQEKERPTIFVYHGWSSQKENYQFMARILAFHGYGVMVPDAPYHGERGILEYENVHVMEQKFWRIVIRAVDEFKLLLEEAHEKLGINSQKVAVMGSSMGGIIASGIFAKDTRIKTLINMNGACAWEDAEKRVRILRCVDRAVSIGIEELRQYDPMSHLEALYPRPILIQHGDCDTSIPVETQWHFYNEAARMYKNRPDNLRLTVIKNLNHHKTIGMLEEVVDWLQCHL
ncbi:alpha/beta fold hydrolase [Desulfitibacter alkalitolerans]|uniref:alpha/beta fold hydrolase n=1 Tax=Desulfitibacter alkalitolerans TaxID=264641 RepID=UPI000480209B|nr:alpha/beta fold hydrolase [Desulfitibacter alkalitolerans]